MKRTLFPKAGEKAAEKTGESYGAESPEAFERMVREARNRFAHYVEERPADPAVYHLLLRAESSREAALRGDDLGGGIWSNHGWSVDIPDLDAANQAILRRNIRRRAESMKWKPQTLSVKAGLSPTAVRQFLSGRIKGGRADTINRLASALLCTADDLTGASIFQPMTLDMASPLRRYLGRVFMQAEQWRNEADEAEDSDGVLATQYAHEKRMQANTLDFIDGPYEWQNSWTGAHQDIKAANALTFPPSTATPFVPAPFNPQAMAPPPQPSARTFPIYAAAQGGPEGAQVLDFNPVEYRGWPEHLTGISDAWGVVIVDDSMEPALEHGDTALINPRLKPERGRNHVFVKTTPDGTFMMVKRLESMTESEWKVRQHNPDKRFALKRSEWRQAFRITGKYDR